MIFRLRRHAGTMIAGVVSMLALVSPILMTTLPNLDLLGLKEHQLLCQVECDGLLVSMAFKLFALLIGTWGVFYRRPRATLPRIHVYRSLVCLLVLVFLVSFWLFYAVHVVNDRTQVKYKSLVQFAVNLVDSLLFVHYLAIILIELRHQSPVYAVKIVRSPDGESRTYPIGQFSIQRAASWVLDKYYTDFNIYNPYLDRVMNGGPRHRKGVKVYDVDGNPTGNVSSYTSYMFLQNFQGGVRPTSMLSPRFFALFKVFLAIFNHKS